MVGPLEGVRVLDLGAELTRFASKVLRELGADVARVGRMERGRPLAASADLGLLEWWFDGGIRRLELSLDNDSDVGQIRSIMQRCDVVLSDSPVVYLAERGLGSAELSALNERLVHVSMSPFGPEGPRSHWRSSDLVLGALSGIVATTGFPDTPLNPWGRQSLSIGGFYAAICALAGLARVREGSRGMYAELSVQQAMVSCSEQVLMYYWYPEYLGPFGAPIASRQGSLHWSRGFEVVPCRRGYCMISPAAGSAPELIAWLKAKGFGLNLPDEPEGLSLLGLVPKLMAALRDYALTVDAAELFEAGQSLHKPFGEARGIAGVASCPQLQARGFFRRVTEDAGAATTPGSDSFVIPGPLVQFPSTPLDLPQAPALQTTSSQALLDEWYFRPAVSSQLVLPASSSALPLQGLRVLDFSHVLAGPFATRILADLGADVLKIQTELRAQGASGNEFPYFAMWNRSKRSIALDMKHGEALGVLRRLVAQADVVIDNFAAGVLGRWGAGPQELREWNPRIVSIAMTGAGETGPWKDYVTYAPTVQALCAMTALTGPPGRPDCGPGVAFNDHLSGLAGATALLAAVLHAREAGEGQHLDMSQLEVGAYLVGPALVDYFATGKEAVANGNIDPFTDLIFNDVIKAIDGDWVAVTVVDALDADRLARATAGEPVCGWVARQRAAEAVEALQAAGIAAGVVANAEHLMEGDPQLASQSFVVTCESPIFGSRPTERFPARVFDMAGELQLTYRPAPAFGEHTFDVYKELLGWDDEHIADAIGKGLFQ